MAFLVCYSAAPPADHARKQAAYLDQRFYELIVAHCRADEAPYAVLRDIASLRYKSPTLVLKPDRLALLERELTQLEVSGVSHPQLAELRLACSHAKAEGCSLTISGDMYPEL